MKKIDRACYADMKKFLEKKNLNGGCGVGYYCNYSYYNY